jgi:orotidine-5'-phosphate decarboxylase
MDITPHNHLALALDVPNLTEALSLFNRTKKIVKIYKVGLELYIAAGPTILRSLHEDGAEVFLDLKLHDIPNTVRSAVEAAYAHKVSLLTVHTLGGATMLSAARNALPSNDMRLLGVTVLTHMSEPDLRQLGIDRPIDSLVSNLTALACGANLHGIVCSPHEAAAVKNIVGNNRLVVCPGIRDGDSTDDQTRTTSAQVAIRNGADLLVVGRPIRNAANPADAAKKFLDEIAIGLQSRKEGCVP